MCVLSSNLDVIEKFSIIPDVALGFIAFSIGAEFKLSYLKKVGMEPLVIAFTEAIGAVLLVDLVLIIAGYEISFVLVLSEKF